MTTKLSCMISLLLAVGCGPRQLPRRSSPVLTSDGGTAILASVPSAFAVVEDARRDGVFAAGPDVVVIDKGVASPLFTVPDGQIGKLSSRGQLSAVAVRPSAMPWEGNLLRRDGASLVNLTARLKAALLAADLVAPGIEIEAVDIDADGSIAVAVADSKLCILREGGDACESFRGIAKPHAAVENLVFDLGRVMLVASYQIFERTSVGVWSKRIEEQGAHGRALEDGRFAFDVWQPARQGYSVHLLTADWREEKEISAPGNTIGHSPSGFWLVAYDQEIRSQTCSAELGTCPTPTVYWSQVVVSHLALDGTTVEVGHLEDDTSIWPLAPRFLPTTGGGLHLETSLGAFDLQQD